MGTQIIITAAGERLAILPEADYLALVELAEDASDLVATHRIMDAINAGEEELVSSEFVDRILNGEAPVRVWREHRGISVKALAQSSGVSTTTIRQIERGQHAGSLTSLAKIAEALRVKVDDLISANKADQNMSAL